MRISSLGARVARRALGRFHEAERAPPEHASQFYDDARRWLEEAVRYDPAHPAVPLVLVYVALAFERTGRPASAAETYQRILREYRIDVDAYAQPLVGYVRQQRINIFDEAHLRVAENLVRRFEFDAALQAYQRLTTDPTLAAAEGHTERLLRAWSAVARLHEWHGRTVEAEAAWRVLAAVEAPGAARDDAQYRALTVAYRAGEWSRAAAPMRAFLSQSPDDGAHAPFAAEIFVQTDLPFTVRPALMSSSPPGSIVLQPTPVATPGLVTE